MKGWVVTGTDTGVGKTVVAAALCVCRRHDGAEVVYVKPVQSGAADGDDDAADVRALADVPAVNGPMLGPGLAPGVAARLGDLTVTSDELLGVIQAAADAHPEAELVVEGAGGILVELGSDGTTAADLAEQLSLPVVVVARPGLGTLNHTALTLEALDRRGLDVAGVVVCDYPADPDLATSSNLAELEGLSGGRMAGVVPHLPVVAPAALAAAPLWLGPAFGGAWTLP